MSFKVLILSGRSVENLLKDAEDHLKNNTYGGMYFMGGVNNLTLNHCSKRIAATVDEIPNCVDTMFTKFERGREPLMKYSRRIIICFLTWTLISITLKRQVSKRTITVSNL